MNQVGTDRSRIECEEANHPLVAHVTYSLEGQTFSERFCACGARCEAPKGTAELIGEVLGPEARERYETLRGEDE